MKLNISILSILAFLLIFSLNVTSCKKVEENTVDEVCSGNPFSVLTAYGRVHYDDPALNGCGWYILIDEEKYKATNFETEYEQYLVDNLIVEFDYTDSNCKGRCGLIAPDTYNFSRIEILKMK